MVAEQMDYRAIFEKTHLYDCKLVCSDGEIPAHKLVLIDKCQYARDNIKNDQLKVDYPMSQVLPVIRYIYGYVEDVKGKYSIFGVADLFQLTYKYKYRDCIEFSILIGWGNAKLIAKFVNEIGNDLVQSYLQPITLLLLKYTKVTYSVGANSDNVYLAKLPTMVLEEYLSSDFLYTGDEINIARFLLYYEEVTDQNVTEKMRLCLRSEYCGEYGSTYQKFVVKSKKRRARFVDSRPRLCQVMSFDDSKLRKAYKNYKTTHSIALTTYTSSRQSNDSRVGIRELTGIGIYPSLGKYIATEERMSSLNYILDTTMTLDITTPYEIATVDKEQAESSAKPLKPNTRKVAPIREESSSEEEETVIGHIAPGPFGNISRRRPRE